MQKVRSFFGKVIMPAVLLCAACWGLWWLFHSPEKAKAEARGILRAKATKSEAQRIAPARSQIRIKSASAVTPAPASAKTSADGWADDLMLSAAANAELTDEYRQMLKDIQAALDEGTFGKGSRAKLLAYVDGLLSRLQAGEKLPLLVQSKMIRALAACGTDAAPELAGSLAWADVSLSGEVANAFEEILIDADGDRELSAVIKSAVKGLKDASLLEGILAELGSMRNSVRVETALAIYASGNDAAIKVLENNLSSYFGNQEGVVVKTREDVIAYGKNNPDGENDEEFYGPWQHDAATDNVK